MSQIGSMGAPTPRRSNRISTKASSVAAESVVTTATNGGARLRRKGPLTKVKARKSNAYGASGRVGAAEELSVSATGFAQAFQNQRGDAFARDDEDDDDDEEEDDDIDELGVQTPRMGGALNGQNVHPSSSPAPGSSPRAAPALSFADSEDITPSDDDLAASIGNTSKSFGPLHEAGMLYPQEPSSLRFSSPQGTPALTPLLRKTGVMRRTFQSRTRISAPTQAQAPIPEAPIRPRAIQQPTRQVPVPNPAQRSGDDMTAEDQARIQRLQDHRDHTNQPHTVDEWLGNVQAHQEEDSKWAWIRVRAWAVWGVAGTVLLGLLLYLMMTSGTPPASGSRVPNLASAVGARVSYTVGWVAEYIQPRPLFTSSSDAEEWVADESDGDTFLWNRMRQVDNKVNNVQTTIAALKKQLPEFLIVRRYPDGHIEIPDQFWEALVSKARSKEDDSHWLEFLKENKRKLEGILDNSEDRDSNKIQPHAITRREFVDLMAKNYREMSTEVDAKIEKAIQGQNQQHKAIIRAEARKVMMENIKLFELANSHLVANYEHRLKAPNYFSPGTGAYIEPRLTSTTFSDRSHSLPRIFQQWALASLRNPPKAALQDWNQPGDCWCSAPDSSRKGQVQLAVSLGRPMTPRQVTIEHVPISMVPGGDISSAPRDIEFWVETAEPAEPNLDRAPTLCQEGPPGWQCLGTFKYNIHDENYFRTFELTSKPSSPISKAMLRVMTNWGADHTCLYQVRLHGDDATPYVYQVA